MKEATKSASSEAKRIKTFSGKVEKTNEQVEQKNQLIGKFALIIISGSSGVGKSEILLYQ